MRVSRFATTLMQARYNECPYLFLLHLATSGRCREVPFDCADGLGGLPISTPCLRRHKSRYLPSTGSQPLRGRGSSHIPHVFVATNFAGIYSNFNLASKRHSRTSALFTTALTSPQWQYKKGRL